jgi:hypothetical protein
MHDVITRGDFKIIIPLPPSSSPPVKSLRGQIGWESCPKLLWEDVSLELHYPTATTSAEAADLFSRTLPAVTTRINPVKIHTL